MKLPDINSPSPKRVKIDLLGQSPNETSPEDYSRFLALDICNDSDEDETLA